ncbi:M23 family metallopeptidase [Sphingomonas sp. BIUV-7]|uniref:M23 family metallopeptidase n=1 Tax=Sphingomonas natans TaxID=3063330 RepID=A0ABT8YEM3_9SPHN|nr:M23 family metallopeptidase [Sphingomonas sp. BIUV-7]MDO6416397.1 M23 family metallopeptidase [Sphingomonas sp. BIUV-7]
MRRAVALATILLLASCEGRPTVSGPGTPPPSAGQPIAPPPPRIVPGSQFGLTGEMTQGTLLRGTAPTGTALLLLDGKPVRVAPDGRFILGINRDAGPSALLEARLQDGRLLQAPLSISKRAWDISNLSTLAMGTSPSPAYQKIRAAELVQINAAKTLNADSDGWRQPMMWPTSGRISTLFGSQRIYKGGVPGAYHGGIDIARPIGTPALAPADGVVGLATAAPFSLEGNLVMIDHGFGLISAIMHLSRIDVKTGDHVRKGQVIGLVGKTGRATGPHLHWGLTWYGARIDPLLVAGPMPQG